MLCEDCGIRETDTKTGTLCAQCAIERLCMKSDNGHNQKVQKYLSSIKEFGIENALRLPEGAYTLLSYIAALLAADHNTIEDLTLQVQRAQEEVRTANNRAASVQCHSIEALVLRVKVLEEQISTGRVETIESPLLPQVSYVQVYNGIYTVYFIQDDQTSNIKIGMTGRLVGRLGQLRREGHEIIRVVGYHICDSWQSAGALESYLHRKFSDYRIGGDWFRANEDLYDYILHCSHNISDRKLWQLLEEEQKRNSLPLPTIYDNSGPYGILECEGDLQFISSPTK